MNVTSIAVWVKLGADAQQNDTILILIYWKITEKDADHHPKNAKALNYMSTDLQTEFQCISIVKYLQDPSVLLFICSYSSCVYKGSSASIFGNIDAHIKKHLWMRLVAS